MVFYFIHLKHEFHFFIKNELIPESKHTVPITKTIYNVFIKLISLCSKKRLNAQGEKILIFKYQINRHISYRAQFCNEMWGL
jgi:hypothetical protein